MTCVQGPATIYLTGRKYRIVGTVNLADGWVHIDKGAQRACFAYSINSDPEGFWEPDGRTTKATVIPAMRVDELVWSDAT